MFVLSLALVSLVAQDTAVDSPCRIHGRLVDATGQPVAGASLTAHGWGANNARKQRYGVPANWQDPDPVESGDDGSFELSFVPPRAFQFTLKVEHDGYGKLGWRWGEIEPGDELDLGETVLEKPAVLTGHIVDSSGELLVEGWRVGAWHNWNSGRSARSSQGSYATIDRGSGTFRVDDLPPGPIRLSASSDAGNHIEKSVVTKLGEVTEVQLVYSGPDQKKRLVVTILSPRPFYTFDPAQGSVHATGTDGVRRELFPAPGRSNDWHVLDVPPGAYTVRIEDPRFEPVRLEGVQTGSPLQRMRLAGSSTIELTVTADGVPLGAYGLRAKYRNVNFSPDTFTVAEDSSLAPQGGLFRHFVAGDIELEVRAEGFPPQFARVDALLPGETRKVVLPLEPALALRGRVMNADGTAAAGLRVQVTRGEHAGHDHGPGSVSSTSKMVGGEPVHVTIGYRDAETATDSDGRFEFPELGAGHYTLRAFASRWAFVDGTAELGRETSEEPVLTLPELGSAAVQVVLPASTELERVRLLCVRWDDDLFAPWSGRGAPGMAFENDGTCTLTGLKPGEYDLFLAYQAIEDDRDSSWLDVSLGTVTIEAGARVESDFDVSETLPASGTIQIHVGGRAAVSAMAHLQARNGRVRDGQGWSQRPGAVWHRAPPGRYSIRVRDNKNGWAWLVPDELELAPGEHFDITVDVPVVEREVYVLDAAGGALANAEMTWWNQTLVELRRSPMRRPKKPRGRTDAKGSLGVLSLPPGAFRFEHIGAEAPEIEVAWEQGDGPLEIILRDGR